MTDTILPWGSKRQHLFHLLSSGIKIIRSQGWKVFISKSKNKVKQAFILRDSNNYSHWINKFEPGTAALRKKSLEVEAFPYRPLISLITPVWNTDPAWLKAMFESVSAQVYGNWELCIAEGGSTRIDTRNIVRQYASADPRIKPVFLDNNLGISGNSNAALALAKGEFIALLDHDDTLAPNALFEVIKVLNENPDWDMMYSDEDKINTRSRRVEPFFKPDWSPDFFLSCMYIGHLGVYRKSVIDRIGGFRSKYDGSQDYDLALRFIDYTQKIKHIPQILYHWRIIPGSAAGDTSAKPYAYIAGKNALSDYIQRNHIPGEVLDGQWPGVYRLKRAIIGNPEVSIIIPTKDKPSVLKTCIQSIIEKTTYPNYEIIMVDNQSREEATFEYYRALQNEPRVKLLTYDMPFNFSAINNLAVTQARGSHLLFLNNDTEVVSGEWLSAMLEHSQRPEVGIVGAKLIYQDQTIQHCGVIIGLGGIAGHPFSKQINHTLHGNRPEVICNYSAVTAACLMIRRDVFEGIGGFDQNLAVDYNDIDLCLRVKSKGYSVVFTPYSKLYHFESLTRGLHDNPEKMALYQIEVNLMRQRWSDYISHGDPFYNPNLSLEKGDFSLNFSIKRHP